MTAPIAKSSLAETFVCSEDDALIALFESDNSSEFELDLGSASVNLLCNRDGEKFIVVRSSAGKAAVIPAAFIYQQ